MLKYLSIFMGVLLSSGIPFLTAGDNYHFYRPALQLQTCRFEKPALTTLSAYVAHGSTEQYHNSCGEKICLTDLSLSTIPSSRFTITEAQFTWIQNCTKYTFLKAFIPIRSLMLSFKPTEGYSTHFRLRGAGDLALSAGISSNFENFTTLDFIDATFEGGVIVPVSSTATFSYELPLSLGYGGHTGYFARGTAALGVFDWMTFTVNAGFIAFTRNYQQFGCAPHDKACVWFRPGIISFCDVNFIADHFIRGWIFAVQYTYNNQQNASFRHAAPPTGPLALGWNMQSMGLFLAYDFASHYRRNLPEVGVFANIPFKGKNIFSTTVGGAYMGITIDWRF